MTADLIRRLEEATEALRAHADHKALCLSVSLPDNITARDHASDTMAQFAEAVTAILKSLPTPDAGPQADEGDRHEQG